MAVFSVLLLMVSFNVVADGRCPLGWCKSCIPVSVFEAPGIGINLSLSHASVAAI